MKKMNCKTETVPVFANRAPWNELVLRGKRRVKTLPFNWKYRGQILLYTSSNRIDDFGWEFYPKALRNVHVDDLPKGFIVGYATVVDVVNEYEFTNLQPFTEVGSKYDGYFKHDPALMDTLGQAYVVLIENPKRFKKPILYKPPQGAVRISRAPASYLRRPTV